MSPDVRMRTQTIRFSDSQWQLISAAARLEHSNTSQFIREAAHSRALLRFALHSPRVMATLMDLGGPEVRAALEGYIGLGDD